MLIPGQKVLHYRLLEKLGVGGMGVVFKAEDTRLRRMVALKFLSEELAPNEKAAERFRREAQAASALNHPNICTIYDVEEFEGQPVIAMELLEGESLKQLMAGKPVRAEIVADLGIQMAEGLDAAHRKGIIHRDIKPANIFVTNGGVVKIVDFGVAKMQGYLNKAFSHAAGAGGETLASDSDASTVAVNYLTGPGQTVGTIAYMSPEQARGEILDARTDLFSLGAVLYEMAVGKPSAPGTTTANVFDAILNRMPTRPRQVVTDVPAELERIIEKALEKDRTLRYQHASGIAADLRRLKQDLGSGIQAMPAADEAPVRRRSFDAADGPASDSAIVAGVIKRHKRGIIAALVATLALMASAAWFLLRTREPAPLPDLTQVDLTFNSAESPVASFALSGDGKTLAYSDPAGIHIKLLATGEERVVQRPAGVPASSYWEVADWFPDGTRVLVNLSSGVAGGPNSIWALSILSESPRKILDNAWAWKVSPDGTQIAYSPPKTPEMDAHELWLMDSQGGNPQKVLTMGEFRRFGAVRWSPDGKRLGYIRRETAHPADVSSIETCDLHGADCMIAVPVDEGHWYTDFCWVPGRLLYSRGDAPGANGLWEAAISSSGKADGKPRRLMQWNAFIVSLSASGDGKHLAFLKHARQGLIEWGQLTGGGAKMGPPQRLTNDEAGGSPSAWTADSTQVLITLLHNGKSGIFKQGLHHEAPDMVRTGSDSAWTPRLSPDGAWIVYFESSKNGANLKRIPLNGGTPELVMPVKTALNFQCPQRSGNCVIVERSSQKGKYDLTAFDVMKGRGNLLRTFDGDAVGMMPPNDLSPDGLTLALGREAGKETRIQLLSLNNGTDREIVAKGWTGLSALDWAPNGKGLYGGFVSPQSRSLVYVDLNGNAQVVREYGGAGTHYLWGIPSPDGKYVAILGDPVSANVWMLNGL